MCLKISQNSEHPIFFSVRDNVSNNSSDLYNFCTLQDLRRYTLKLLVSPFTSHPLKLCFSIKFKFLSLCDKGDELVRLVERASHGHLGWHSGLSRLTPRLPFPRHYSHLHLFQVFHLVLYWYLTFYRARLCVSVLLYVPVISIPREGSDGTRWSPPPHYKSLLRAWHTASPPDKVDACGSSRVTPGNPFVLRVLGVEIPLSSLSWEKSCPSECPFSELNSGTLRKGRRQRGKSRRACPGHQLHYTALHRTSISPAHRLQGSLDVVGDLSMLNGLTRDRRKSWDQKLSPCPSSVILCVHISKHIMPTT